jgi:hypothetical protein
MIRNIIKIWKINQKFNMQNYWPTKRIWEWILLIGIFVFPFVAGYLVNFGVTGLIIGIFCLVMAICSHIAREKIQANVEGNGVTKITASENRPQNPKEGELWIQIKK